MVHSVVVDASTWLRIDTEATATSNAEHTYLRIERITTSLIEATSLSFYELLHYCGAKNRLDHGLSKIRSSALRGGRANHNP